MPLSLTDYAESLEKGKKSLEGYYDHYKNAWPRNIATEYAATAYIDFTDADNNKQKLELRGKLDKVEFNDGNNVTVIDYKTRQPLTRNDIEGKTKTSTGDYKRQLVFYKLLLSNQEKPISMTQGAIDFIEPDNNGKFKKEYFEITDEEVHELLEQVKKVAQEIYSLSFWDTECGEKDCEYCELRKALKEKVEKNS